MVVPVAAVGATVAAAVVGALILRNLLYQWRYEFAISLLGLLLAGFLLFTVVDNIGRGDE